MDIPVSSSTVLMLPQEGLPDNLLKLSRMWTPAEWIQADFTDLTIKEARMSIHLPLPDGTVIKSWLLAKYLPPADNMAAGYGDDMLELQKYFLRAEIKEKLLASQNSRADHLDRMGTAFDVAWSTEPTHRFGVSQAALQMSDNARILGILARLVKDVLEKHLPEYQYAFIIRDWARSVSATYGHEDQNNHTNVQINLTIEAINKDDLSSAIKKKGVEHLDQKDVARSHTIVFFLHHSKNPNYCYGRFIQHGQRLACPALPYGILILTSRYPHCGKGAGEYPLGTDPSLRFAYPEGLKLPVVPNELEGGKLNIVSYSRMDNMYSIKSSLRDNVLTDEATAVLLTKRNTMEFRLRHWMHLRSADDPRSAQDWVDEYSWEEDGKVQKPRLSIAEEMLREDDEADALVGKLNKLLLAKGIGNSMPKDPEASIESSDTDKPTKGNWVKGAAKVLCIGHCKSRKKDVLGKPCETKFLPGRWPDQFCGNHRIQATLAAAYNPQPPPPPSADDLAATPLADQAEREDEEVENIESNDNNGGPSKRQRIQ